MPSILLQGGDQQTREERAKEILQNYYLHYFEEEGKILPLPKIREILPHLYLLPPSPWKGRGVIILEAQRLSEEVQNTLLKTLEEPPSFLTFVLTVPSPRLLLPTVTSRCLIETVGIGQKEEGNDVLAQKILTAEAGQRLAIFEDKVGYEPQSINGFLGALEISLAEKRSADFTQLLPQIWKTKKLLQNPSANLKLTVDQLLLSW